MKTQNDTKTAETVNTKINVAGIRETDKQIGAWRKPTLFFHAIACFAKVNGTFRALAEARLYFNSRGTGMNPVRAALWIHGGYGVNARGIGSASGSGYCKKSAAISCALRDAGISIPRELDCDGLGLDAAKETLMSVCAALAEAFPAAGIDPESLFIFETHA